MDVLEVEALPRHKVAELNRGGKQIYDEAATTGVVLDATATRPELVMMPATEALRQRQMVRLGQIAAEVLEDVAPLLQGRRSEHPHLAWLSLFDADEVRQFAADFSHAARLSIETGNPRPALQVLYRWRSTAEYALEGAPLSADIDWDGVVLLERPALDGPAA